MDHSRLYKQNSSKRSENKQKDRIKRRSLAQRENRQKNIQRTDLSPLQENDVNVNIVQTKSRSEKLAEWKKERDRKKFEQTKKYSKPVFKVSSNIKYEDNKFRSSKISSSKSKSQSKENKPIKVSAKTTRQDYPTARTTRSRTKKQATVTKQKSAENKENSKENLQSTKFNSDPPTPDKENGIMVTKNRSHNETEESEKSQNMEENGNQPQPAASESFAPANYVFKAPPGLKNITFSLPNSNDSFMFSAKGGSMNFFSSTPVVSNPTKRKKPEAVPMILSSASGSGSSDENAEETVKPASTVRNGINKEKEEKVEYFRNLITSESEILNNNCKDWEKIKEENKDALDEEVVGEILTVIGQAQLLMAERFDQFSGLIDKYETPTPDHNPVNPTDLKGFWDMIYNQVDDVRKKFDSLKTLKENNWKREEEATRKGPVTRKRKAAANKIAKGSSAHRRAARKRIREAREAMKEKLKNEENEINETKEPLAQPSKSSSSSISKGLPTPVIPTRDDQEEGCGVRTRSRRKTPGTKNVSFASPQSKKRKARFDIDSDDDDKIKKSTPVGSQPRKRVMRKTPLPGARPDSVSQDELNMSCNEDIQASPSLKLNKNKDENLGEDNTDKGEIKGLKLNFDDVPSDEEENKADGLDVKYLLPSVSSQPDENAEASSNTGLDLKYLTPSVSDSAENSPAPLPNVTSANKQTPLLNIDSPGRILRNKRKSQHNPMSPFMPSKKVASPTTSNNIVDLMSFSPLATDKTNGSKTCVTTSDQGNNFMFPSLCRRSTRLKTPLDSLDFDSDNINTLDNSTAGGVGLIPSLL